jgi:hypothetical protein
MRLKIPPDWRLTLILAVAAVVLAVLLMIEVAQRYPLSWSTLEAAGVEFTNGGQPGVRLKEK